MPKQQSFNFERSFKELEEIVNKFETGEINLEQSLDLFEQGLKLAQQLKERLKTVENKIVEIKQKFNQEED